MPGRKKIIDDEKVRELALKGLNASDIARELKVDRSGVSRAMDKLGVKQTPPPSDSEELTLDLSDSALPMLRDSLITVRTKLLKEISNKPDRAERSIETLVKLSAEIRQVELARGSVKAKLDDRKTIFDLFEKTMQIISENIPNPLRGELLEKFSKMKNEYLNEKPIKEALRKDE